MKTMKFEVVSSFKDQLVELPKRQTSKSAGYDIRILKGGWIEPFETKIFDTGLKVRMPDHVYLKIVVRSSVGIKNNLVLANGTGIIDADYYNNDDNEGHIKIAILNLSDRRKFVQDGERIAQGIFSPYYITEDDLANNVRKGGIGSTD